MCVCVQYTHRALAISTPVVVFSSLFFLADAAAWPKRGIVPCHPQCSLSFSVPPSLPCSVCVPYLPGFLLAHPYCVQISKCVCVLEGQQKLLLRPFSIGCVFLFLFSLFLTLSLSPHLVFHLMRF